jgi:hypothetical protein
MTLLSMKADWRATMISTTSHVKAMRRFNDAAEWANNLHHFAQRVFR